MNGGEDTCNYYGNGTMVGQPVCKCKPGFSGTWCEVQENVQSKEIQSKNSGETNEAIEPRNSGTSISGNGLFDKTESTTDKDVTQKTAANDVENTSKVKNEIMADKPVTDSNEKEDNGKHVTVKDEEIVTSKQNVEGDIRTTVNDVVKITTSSTSEPIVTSEDVDWSKKSNTNAPISETTIEGKASSKEEPASKKEDKVVEEVSELGVRAIHSDVFNSGKLIESFGSEGGLQSFNDY